jgi:D-alanyl-D-alanine carboxypeptidase/D-alanyl-D-alanine-endopeptidase (penicillin-binding protein 4)
MPSVQLAARQSPPLIDILQVTDKISSNLWAEIVLREVARIKTGVGSREAGLKEVAAFLAEIGIPPKAYSLYDASGLSRLGLVKPAAVTRLLEYMHQSRYSKEWKSLLPIGGFDGTLINRFPGESDAGRLHAKTGALTHVAALSGYVVSASFGDLAFSIMVNNYNAPASEIRQAIDKIGLALLR